MLRVLAALFLLASLSFPFRFNITPDGLDQSTIDLYSSKESLNHEFFNSLDYSYGFVTTNLSYAWPWFSTRNFTLAGENNLSLAAYFHSTPYSEEVFGFTCPSRKILELESFSNSAVVSINNRSYFFDNLSNGYSSLEVVFDEGENNVSVVSLVSSNYSLTTITGTLVCVLNSCSCSYFKTIEQVSFSNSSSLFLYFNSTNQSVLAASFQPIDRVLLLDNYSRVFIASRVPLLSISNLSGELSIANGSFYSVNYSVPNGSLSGDFDLYFFKGVVLPFHFAFDLFLPAMTGVNSVDLIDIFGKRFTATAEYS